jgi:hypothetical protein
MDIRTQCLCVDAAEPRKIASFWEGLGLAPDLRRGRPSVNRAAEGQPGGRCGTRHPVPEHAGGQVNGLNVPSKPCQPLLLPIARVMFQA